MKKVKYYLVGEHGIDCVDSIMTLVEALEENDEEFIFDIVIPQHAIVKVWEATDVPVEVETIYRVQIMDLEKADVANYGLGDYTVADKEGEIYFTTDYGLFDAYTHREIIIRYSKDIALKF